MARTLGVVFGLSVLFTSLKYDSTLIVGCVSFLIPLLPPFSGLLASFCVLTGTGKSITTLWTLEQNNCFLIFLALKNVAVSFLAFCGIQTIWEKLALTFSRKSKVALMKLNIEWREGVILKQTNKRIGTSRPLFFQKIETPRHLRIKNETARRT